MLVGTDDQAVGFGRTAWVRLLRGQQGFNLVPLFFAHFTPTRGLLRGKNHCSLRVRLSCCQYAKRVENTP